MTETEILLRQTEDTYRWTLKLIEGVGLEKWDVMPPVVDSTLTWQVGHLLVSAYYHSIWVVKGHQMDVLQAMPMKQYGELFTKASPTECVGKVDSGTLLNHLKLMHAKSLAILSTLSASDLESPLEPTPTEHPVAKTKFEAIDWNIKHTMYHCGQIGMLRRMVDQRYDFRLKIGKQAPAQ